PADVPEEVSEDVPEEVPDDVPEEVPDDVPEEVPGSAVMLPKFTVAIPVSKISPYALLNKMLLSITVPIGSCGVPAAEFEIPYSPLFETILFLIILLLTLLRAHPSPLLMPS